MENSGTGFGEGVDAVAEADPALVDHQEDGAPDHRGDEGGDEELLRQPGLLGRARLVARLRAIRRPYAPGQHRSEEHTSELQSLMRNSYAVFCLKKKNTHKRL